MCNCDPLPIEEWIKVAGFVGYLISNLGEVKSLERTYPDSIGRIQWVPERILKQVRGKTTHSYPRVSLKKNTKQYVHILMLESFVGPRPPGKWGLHDDDISDHNHLPNLYWGTPSQNAYDAVRHGTHSSFVRHDRKTSQ